MFKHILVATDGSPLSNAAVENALNLARDAGAKVTVLTATEPFHVMTANSKQIADTRATYEQHTKAEAARLLAETERKAKALGVPCQDRPGGAGATVQGDHRDRQEVRLRPDRHGVARPARCVRPHHWQ